jgi:hypothetical protein
MPRPKASKRRSRTNGVPASQLRARKEYVKSSGVVITDEMVEAIRAEIHAAVTRAHARLRRARRAGKA